MDLLARFGIKPFTGAQVKAAGISHRQWLTVRPQLQQVSRGIYVVQFANDARSRHAQKVAATLLHKTDHFAVGLSAVCLLGLPRPQGVNWDQVPVSIAGRKTRTKRGIRRVDAVPIPTPWGLCTDLVHTAVAIAETLPLPEALMVTDAVAIRLAGPVGRIERASESCRVRVRMLLTETSDLPALALANPAVDEHSPAESFYRGHMLLEGHDDPACGVPKQGASGDQYYIDVLVDDLAIEIDGEEKYDGRDALVYEKKREDDLRLTGLSFLRSWVKDLYNDPQQRMKELGHKLDEVRWLRRRSG